jgi:transposase
MILPKLGLDIGQDTFAACLLRDSKSPKRSFANKENNFCVLSQWLNKSGVSKVHACMEATGRYGYKLAKYLREQGHKVSIVNPKLVSKHREALNKQNKTDPNDAYVNAHYAKCFEPDEWQPRSALREQLVDVSGQLNLLKKTVVALSNRGQCGLVSTDVIAINNETLAFLREQIVCLEKLRDSLLKQDQELEREVKIYDSVPGMGVECSTSLAAKIDWRSFRTGRELAYFLGLGSREWQSGKQKRKGKQTKTGDSGLRSVLRMGAMSATYTCPLYIQFAEGLRKKGLKEGQIITAVARKMVLIAHALLRKQQLFDCCYQHPLAKAS